MEEPDLGRPIYQRIDEIYASLPPQSRRVADVVLDRLGEIGTYSVAELATLSATSAATVSRLFATLGFDDFAEVKAHTRSLRREGIPITGVVQADRTPALQREIENLRRIHETAAGGTLDDLSRRIAEARQVVIMGFRNSFSVATMLREFVRQARPQVHYVPQQGQSMGSELAALEKGDVVIVFGFRRRLSQFDDLMRFLSGTGAQVVLIADSTARRHASWAHVWIDCPIDSDGAFDSYASAMSLVSLIGDRVLEILGQQGQRNVVRIATAYESLNELDGEDLGYRRTRTRGPAPA